MMPLSLGSIAGPSYRSRCQSSISLNARSSIDLEFMAASLAPHPHPPPHGPLHSQSNGRPGGMGGGVFHSRPLLPDYPVPQHSDRLNLQLDDVTGAQVAIHLKAAPATDRPRSEKISGIDGLPARHVGDHLGERPVNRPEPSSRPDFAVHPREHHERIEVRNLVWGYEAGADGGGEVLPFGRSEAAGHLLELDVPRAEVIH